MLIFMGTSEEFEVVRPTLEALGAQVAVQESGATETDSLPTDPELPTIEEARQALRYNGGLSKNQKNVFDVLYAADGEVPNEEIRKQTGLESPQLRGVLGCLPRRARGALGIEKRLVEQRWVEKQNHYWLHKNVREAYESEYGS